MRVGRRTWIWPREGGRVEAQRLGGDSWIPGRSVCMSRWVVVGMYVCNDGSDPEGRSTCRRGVGRDIIEGEMGQGEKRKNKYLPRKDHDFDLRILR